MLRMMRFIRRYSADVRPVRGAAATPQSIDVSEANSLTKRSHVPSDTPENSIRFWASQRGEHPSTGAADWRISATRFSVILNFHSRVQHALKLPQVIEQFVASPAFQRIEVDHARKAHTDGLSIPGRDHIP